MKHADVIWLCCFKVFDSYLLLWCEIGMVGMLCCFTATPSGHRLPPEFWCEKIDSVCVGFGMAELTGLQVANNNLQP